MSTNSVIKTGFTKYTLNAGVLTARSMPVKRWNVRWGSEKQTIKCSRSRLHHRFWGIRYLFTLFRADEFMSLTWCTWALPGIRTSVLNVTIKQSYTARYQLQRTWSIRFDKANDISNWTSLIVENWLSNYHIPYKYKIEPAQICRHPDPVAQNR